MGGMDFILVEEGFKIKFLQRHSKSMETGCFTTMCTDESFTITTGTQSK